MPSNITRVKTGIGGLDFMLQGGIPESNQVVITGGPGAGKTLMAFEIAYKVALSGVPSAYISIEEKPETLLKNVKSTFTSFTKIDELLNNGSMVVADSEIYEDLKASEASGTYSFANFIASVNGIVESNKSKFVVMDSMSVFNFLLPDEFIHRRSMIALASNMQRSGITALFTTELSESDISDLKFQAEFFLFDGVILLYQLVKGERRTFNLEILKMRGTDHSRYTAPYDITPEGFKIYTLEQS